MSKYKQIVNTKLIPRFLLEIEVLKDNLKDVGYDLEDDCFDDVENFIDSLLEIKEIQPREFPRNYNEQSPEERQLIKSLCYDQYIIDGLKQSDEVELTNEDKITMICPYCGSEDVSVSLSGTWCKNRQQWVSLDDEPYYGSGCCGDCNELIKEFNEKPIE